MSSKYQAHHDAIDDMLLDEDFVEYVTQWIDYQAVHQNRLKMQHDLKLFGSDQILERYRPNADTWNKMFHNLDGPQTIKDDQVQFIRLSRNQGWR